MRITEGDGRDEEKMKSEDVRVRGAKLGCESQENQKQTTTLEGVE